MVDDETRALRQERGGLKKTERKAGRQETVRKAQLKAIKQVQKQSGRVGKIAGGVATDMAVQAPIMVGRAGLEAGEKALDVATAGVYTPIDVATTIGGSAFQKVARKPAKHGVGRPVGKQIGKAPYRPVVALQKRRVKAAKKKGARARAARRQIDKELAQDKRAPKKLLSFLMGGLRAVVTKILLIPFELALGLIMAILTLALLLLLLIVLVIIIIPSIMPFLF